MAQSAVVFIIAFVSYIPPHKTWPKCLSNCPLGVENPWLSAENIYLNDKAHNIKYIESFAFSIGIIISMLRVFLGYLEAFPHFFL